MRATVLFFAHLREAAGKDRVEIELPEGASVDSLRDAVEDRIPGLRSRLARYPVVVDGRVAGAGDSLHDGAEVAWLPPVAGGKPEARGLAVEGRLTREAIDVSALIHAVAGSGMGAVALFLGTVRDHEGERRVERLEYEAYERLAEQRLAAVLEEALARWPEARVGVLHRLGMLELGEISVAVAAASPHRAEAFECCRFVIERVKASVPIWKRSFGPQGAAWVEGQEYRPDP